MSKPRTTQVDSSNASELDELAGVLADSARPKHELSAERTAAVWDRISKSVSFEPEHAFFPASGGDWRALADGVALKVFERDPESGMATYLVRYQAGSSFPKHPQHSREECVLVSGDLRIDDQHMQPGDLQVAVAGTDHGPLISQGGALVYVRGRLTSDPSALPAAT